VPYRNRAARGASTSLGVISTSSINGVASTLARVPVFQDARVAVLKNRSLRKSHAYPARSG